MRLSLSTTEKHTQFASQIVFSEVYFPCNGGMIPLSLPRVLFSAG